MGRPEERSLKVLEKRPCQMAQVPHAMPHMEELQVKEAIDSPRIGHQFRKKVEEAYVLTAPLSGSL